MKATASNLCDPLSDAEEATPARLAKRFKGGGETTIRPMLESLVALGFTSRSDYGKRFRGY